jgi:N-acetylated-alpha-linked acidic dipeptidase
MTKFGDPDFAYHATAGRIGAAVLLRLADADVVPYDYAEFARTMKQYLPPIDRAIARRGWTGSTAPIAAAIDRMEQAARAFASARDSVLGAGAPSHAVVVNTNRELRGVERALTRPEGLRGRPWFRSLIYVADEDNGYANMPLPSVNEALRAGDSTLTQREIADLATRFDAATAALDRAREALLGR